jgi:N-acetylglucosaminyldiphosphoundecaprenol N-acetyl-beta-D-mannosaminyltransferase
MKKNNKNTQIKDHKIGQIMGINVTGTSITKLLARVENFIAHNSKFYASKAKTHRFYIVTPNPELVLMAQKDNNLKNAMNGTELAIPDGIGLKFAILDLPIIKGRELFNELIKLAVRKNWKVFLLGGLNDEAKIASSKLKIKYQRLNIEYAQGPKLYNDATPVSENDKRLEKEAIVKINKFGPQLLFVAFGNPKQEIWVHKNYSKLNIGGAMAVGGVFRYTAGLSKLPPKWMASIGLEWLWRVFTEPHRIGRIRNAVIIFPLKLLFHKILKK